MAHVIDRALAPDNQQLPQGMKIEQYAEGRQFVVRISLSRKAATPLETLISTLDEFISHIQTVTQTLEKVEQKEKHDRSKDTQRGSRSSKRQPPKTKHA